MMKATQLEVNPKSPLDTLIEQFAQWRNTRSSRRESTPKHLQQSAVTLLRDYRKSHVIKALGINSTILKNWQNPKPEDPAVSVFIPVNLASLSEGAARLEFTLAYSQGSEITVKGLFSAAQLSAVCQGLRPSMKPLGEGL